MLVSLTICTELIFSMFLKFSNAKLIVPKANYARKKNFQIKQNIFLIETNTRKKNTENA